MNNIIQPIANWQNITKPSLSLQQDSALHFNLQGSYNSTKASNTKGGFSSLMLGALQNVSDQQQNSSLLSQQALVSPDSVNAHTLTTKMSEAALALSLTKAVIDRGLQAYREISSLR